MNAISQTDPVMRVRESGLFDAAHYRTQAGLHDVALDELIRHYLDIGERSGLTPCVLFDPSWYFEEGYGEQRRPEIALLDYISRSGDSPGPHPLFDQAFYLEQARAAGRVVPANLTPLAHYLMSGVDEGLDPHPLFSNAHYLAENSDVRAHGYNPLIHFLTNGWSERRSPCPEFDCAYYLREYGDVSAASINPLIHYVSSGARERRNPSAAFDAAWYTRLLHAEPAAATVNPLVHYIRVGRRLGYLPRRRSFALDDRGMLPREEFDIFAQSLQVVLRNLPHAGLRQPIVLVCAVAESTEATIPGAIALEALAEALAEMNEATLLRCVVLFVMPDDTLLSGALDSIASGFGSATQLLTADSVCFDGGSVLPVLLPGSNPTYLRHTANVPPFAARAAFCRDHARWPGEAAGPWFRRLVTAAVAFDVRSLRHLPLPIVASPLTRYRAEQQSIPPEVDRIAAFACGSEPAGGSPPDEDVSVIICTKDCGQLLAQLVMQLLRPDMRHVREVLIVVNQPGNAFARAYHRELAQFPRVRIIDYPRDYNFSDQCNVGARAASGATLLFLNDDVAPVGVHWLGHMLASLADPDVAVVGPLLLYPDETVQHAGMFLGFNNVAGHCLRGIRLPRHGSCVGLVPAACSCVTGAVMLVRADMYEALNGFDYQLATYLQDVDFCLRVLRTGRRIVFNPHAVLFHMESVSAATILRGSSVIERRGREYQRFARRWGASVFDDRYHNVNWSKQDERLTTLASMDAATLQTALHG